MSEKKPLDPDLSIWINKYLGVDNKNTISGPKKGTSSKLEKEVEKDRMDILREDAEEIKNRGARAEQGLKKDICDWVKCIVSLYLVFVGFILTMLVFEFGKLSDGAIIALLTTTTINILGLPLMIILSLFPSKKNKIN